MVRVVGPVRESARAVAVRRYQPGVAGLEDRRLLTSYGYTIAAQFDGTHGAMPDTSLVSDTQGNS